MKSHLKLLTLIFLLTFVRYGMSQQNINGSFYYKGYLRSYILHVPSGYNDSAAAPLVLNLHGYSSNAAQQQSYSLMDSIADTTGFLVVYPNAVNNVWDTVFGPSPIDDVGFISALIDTIRSDYNIDIMRIYSTGMSMGGFMTYRLACELSDRIAAVASVTGPTVVPIFTACQSTPPIPVMHIHGTADPTVPYGGIGMWPPVDTIIQYFVKKNNCPVIPDSTIIPDIVTTDSSTVVKYHYSPCDDSTEVIFYKIFNGGHTWPDAAFDLYWFGFGHTNYDFNASTEIWKFFERHKLDTTTVTVYAPVPETAFKVFPNPASCKIIISSNETIRMIEVFSASGARIFEIKPDNARNHTLDAVEWQSGFYVLKVESGNRTEYFKLIR